MQRLQQQIDSLLTTAGGTWSVAVEDLNGGTSFALNGDEPFYAASLIKLPIMVAVFAMAEEDEIRLGDYLPLRQEDMVGGCGVLQHLSSGLELSITDLVTLMIIQSDNTATNILIDLVGIERIQAAMHNQGMENSQFYHKLMIVSADRIDNNVITSSDMTRLLKRMAKGEVVSLHASEQMIHILKQQQLSNGFTAYLPAASSNVIGAIREWEIASKTGNVENITHECVLFYAGDGAVAATILSKDCGEEEAKETIAKIGKEIHCFLTSQ